MRDGVVAMIKRIVSVIASCSFFFALPHFFLCVAQGSLSFIHQDHLGSISLVTDVNQQVVQHRVYYPYGATRASLGGGVTERSYTGQVSDQNQTGLYHYGARYYQPHWGIFTQADKKEGPQRYSYVLGNPMRLVDPGGHQVDFSYLGQTDTGEYGTNQQVGGESSLSSDSLAPSSAEMAQIRAPCFPSHTSV